MKNSFVSVALCGGIAFCLHGCGLSTHELVEVTSGGLISAESLDRREQEQKRKVEEKQQIEQNRNILKAYGMTSEEWFRWAVAFGSPTTSNYNKCSDHALLERVVTWRQKGLTPKEAKEWGSLFRRPELVLKWRLVGSSPEEVKRWNALFYDPEIALKWRAVGSSPEEVKKWNALFTDPEEALLWKQAGFNAEEADKLAKEGLKAKEVRELADSWKGVGCTQEQALQWMKEGFKEAKEAELWIKSGFFPSDAAVWARQGFYPRDAAEWVSAGFTSAEAKEYRAHGVPSGSAASMKRRFPRGIESFENLVLENPYAVKGRCFEFIGERFQIISKSTALYKADTFICLVSFDKESFAPFAITEGIVEGIGPFTYRTVLGAPRVVPWVKVLFYKGLE